MREMRRCWLDLLCGADVHQYQRYKTAFYARFNANE